MLKPILLIAVMLLTGACSNEADPSSMQSWNPRYLAPGHDSSHAARHLYERLHALGDDQYCGEVSDMQLERPGHCNNDTARGLPLAPFYESLIAGQTYNIIEERIPYRMFAEIALTLNADHTYALTFDRNAYANLPRLQFEQSGAWSVHPSFPRWESDFITNNPARPLTEQGTLMLDDIAVVDGFLFKGEPMVAVRFISSTPERPLGGGEWDLGLAD